ncbi:MAG TPA: hypothetical protein HA343_04355 [Methanomassiliicoccales archaeon]|jgi:hypothetical protein|nr:hypothetical protein [Methanomassiliicoccales archaeon]
MDEKYPTRLTKGSRYHLVIGTGGGSTLEMDGEFVGYIQYGSDVALTMRMDAGTLRVVPSRSIIYLDILDSKEEKDERPKENGVYFG